MGRKLWELREVPPLKKQPAYSKRHEGARNGDFRNAFFGGMRNSKLYTATGFQQLLILYLAYLIMRVALRVLKRSGGDIAEIEAFQFGWGNCDLDEDIAAMIMECLHYSNVFIDYERMKKNKKKGADDDKVVPFTFIHAMALPGTRLHDVRKDADHTVPRVLQIDPKYCTFRTLHDAMKGADEKNKLTSIWITSRSEALMHDFALGKNTDAWNADWIDSIQFMSRDRGQMRETVETVTRAALAIKKIVSRKSNTWDSLRTILTDKTLLQDWGPFKNQHTIWNIHLLGKLRIANPDEQWGDMASLISDRATTELPQRFLGDLVEKCPTSPVKKRKGAASEKCPTSPTKKRKSEASVGSHVFHDIFGEDAATAGAETLMKHVDREVWKIKSEFGALSVRVKYRMKGEQEYNQKVFSMFGAISEDRLDARFNMLSNFCQIERALKKWMCNLHHLSL